MLTDKISGKLSRWILVAVFEKLTSRLTRVQASLGILQVAKQSCMWMTLNVRTLKLLSYEWISGWQRLTSEKAAKGALRLAA